MKSLKTYSVLYEQSEEKQKDIASSWDAYSILNTIGIDPKTINIEQFKMGLAVELEHGKMYADTNITNDDPILTAKIALAHLKEMPQTYYSKLDMMEKTGDEPVNEPLEEGFVHGVFADALSYVRNHAKGNESNENIEKLAREYYDNHTNVLPHKKQRHIDQLINNYKNIGNKNLLKRT